MIKSYEMIKISKNGKLTKYYLHCLFNFIPCWISSVSYSVENGRVVRK